MHILSNFSKFHPLLDFVHYFSFDNFWLGVMLACLVLVMSTIYSWTIPEILPCIKYFKEGVTQTHTSPPPEISVKSISQRLHVFS